MPSFVFQMAINLSNLWIILESTYYKHLLKTFCQYHYALLNLVLLITYECLILRTDKYS